MLVDAKTGTTNSTMKKRTIVLLLLAALVTHFAAFALGGIVRQRSYSAEYSKAFERENAHVVLGHYSGYRDIAQDIKASRYHDAQCRAEMLATAMLDSLKSCLGNAECSATVEGKVHKVAPEVLSGQALSVERRVRCELGR